MRSFVTKHLTFFENFISFSLFKAVDAIIPLVVIPYLISVVGSVKYGIYAFAFSLIFYLINLIQYGFWLSGVRLVATNKDNRDDLEKIYSRIFSTQIFIATIVLSLLIILTFTVPKFRSEYIVYLFFIPLIIGQLFSPMWLFLGMERMKFITMINILSKSTYAILTFIFIKQEHQYIYISLFQSIGFFVSGIAAQILIKRIFNMPFKMATFKDIKFTLKEGFSAFSSLITPTIYTNTSLFLIGLFGMPQYVSFLQIGSKLSGAFSVLNTILTNVFYPVINRNKSLINKVKYLFISVGFLLSLIMYFGGDIIVRLWIPENQEQIIQVVKILSPSPFFASIISAYGVNGLLVMKKDKLYMILILVGSVVGFITAVTLIPSHFHIGGAIAIVIALGIKAFLTMYYFNRNKEELIEDES
ncbi:oligosaccharide flippase family protein [Ichthyenterobacterium sp. W332]|uniref:Oligosaccharide flippase family protein n=1 Tax=Microcosmobacter mediterraneus TaxID=3075607 RepID=A0ABU2YLE7_9FLAO|nr:oligosaccharide flippase family protein [Ichthyenterobacterium sp. W332]MDT0558731.1 oligosaccharide flippase family protein [Ichthyenterobacterium sp. W332]